MSIHRADDDWSSLLEAHSSVMLCLAACSCPTESCRGKKVTASDGESYLCDKCNQTTTTPNLRYLLSIQVEDETGSQWLSCFNTEAEVS